MVVRSADVAIANARATTRNDVGMCLWYTQEWLQVPHLYPSATAQWNAAKYRHPGDRLPPRGAPVSWTGGAHGYGHSAISLGNGKIRTIDRPSAGRTSDVPLGEIERVWGLTYKGWHEDLGGVRIPWLVPGYSNPANPNGVVVGSEAFVIAQGSLNGRSGPSSRADVVKSRPYGSLFVVRAVVDGWAQEAMLSVGQVPSASPEVGGAWFSTDYLFPQVKPDPRNTAKIAKGDTVTVTADKLTARSLPGGPPTLDKNGKVLVRAKRYRFDVTGAPVDGWVTGGTNWYSSDYLQKILAPPSPNKPGWKKPPTKTLPMTSVPSPVNYLQSAVRVAPRVTDSGQAFGECFVVAQDPDKKGDTRFLLYDAAGVFKGWMTVRDGGHAQTFHAYRSAAGNLYVWTLIGAVAYRVKWTSGAVITARSSVAERADFRGARPVGTHEPWIGWRTATDTRETFFLHDRVAFLDGKTNPRLTVTVPKRTSYAQQSWALSESRIYRIMGKTNVDPPKGTRVHIIDAFDWSARLVLDRFDITAMALPGASSDEPECLTFSGEPGEPMAGKRSGPNTHARVYPLWTMTGI